MLDMWQGVAAAVGVMLIAPNAHGPERWSLAPDGPAFLDQLLTEAAAVYAFDPEKVYLSGHPAGAEFALQLANQPRARWQAVAVHAGGRGSVAPLPRRDAVRVRIYLGAEDTLFPLDRVRATAQALARAGHDTSLIVIPDHDHWFYQIGPTLAAQAWAFSKAHRRSRFRAPVRAEGCLP